MKMVVKPVKRRSGTHASQPDDESRQPDPAQPRIAQRAYELYAQRGHVHGHDLEDWLEAERQILSEARRA